MADVLRTYSPAKVTINWLGIDIKNFAEGTFIEASRNADNTSETVGSQGDVGITFNADNTGTISLTLMQNGETNRLLSAIQLKQDLDGALIRGELVIAEPSGSWIALANDCFIKNPPTIALGDDQQSKTWTFYCTNLRFAQSPLGFDAPNGYQARIDSTMDRVKSLTDSVQSLLG